MTRLEFGSLSFEPAAGAVRRVRVGDETVFDAVEGVVRDEGWGTLEPVVESQRARTVHGLAVVETQLRHRCGALDVRGWTRLQGDASSIRFSFEGRILQDCVAARIGLCVLHPLVLRGRMVEVRSQAGDVEHRAFPQRIAPRQPFRAVAGMRYHLADGTRIEIGFEGAEFETEDHRNWTDAGWKTYAPPLGDGSARHYAAGECIRQAVTLRIDPRPGGAAPTRRVRRHPAPAEIQVTDEIIGVLPRIGLVAGRPTPRDRRPDFLYAGLYSDQGDEVTRCAGQRARELGRSLDVSISITEDEDEDAMVARLVSLGPHLGSVSVHDESHGTPPGSASRIRGALRAHDLVPPIGGGSNLHFAELNRAQLALDELDFVTYGVTPQVHHNDEDRILDTVLALPDTLHDAQLIGEQRPVKIAPITLQLPSDPVDSRYATPFAGAWLLATASALAEAESLVFDLPAMAFAACGATATACERVLAQLCLASRHQVKRVVHPEREIAALAVGGTLLLGNLRADTTDVAVVTSGTQIRRLSLAPFATRQLSLPASG